MLIGEVVSTIVQSGISSEMGFKNIDICDKTLVTSTNSKDNNARALFYKLND